MTYASSMTAVGGAQKQSIPLIELKEKIDLTKKERKFFDLDTQLRVAGGWVRDKILYGGTVRDRTYGYTLKALSRKGRRKEAVNVNRDITMDIRLVLTASTSQVMMKSNGKSIRITNETVEEVMSDTLYGDSIRLQQVLADFMLMAVNFTPFGGQLTVTTSLRKDQLGRSVHLAYLEIRMTHTGAGIPKFLLNQMFGTEEDVSEEGLNLMISRKLVKLMNGDVQYLRQAGKSRFIITAELTAANK